jgi:hypothetical protein
LFVDDGLTFSLLDDFFFLNNTVFFCFVGVVDVRFILEFTEGASSSRISALGTIASCKLRGPPVGLWIIRVFFIQFCPEQYAFFSTYLLCSA